MATRAYAGALNLLRTCAKIRPLEKVLIVTDSATNPAIASTIMASAGQLGVEAIAITMKPRALPGDEPPAPVLAAMLASDVIICPTSRTMYHTDARTMACRRGARFLSMAGATMSVLASPAMFADFEKQERKLRKLVGWLTCAKRIHVMNRAGTDIEFSAVGRRGYGVSGMATRRGEATGTPDIEAYIAPVEGTTNGVLVIDGSTSVTGVVKKPIKIQIEHGMATKFRGGPDASRLLRILRMARSRAAFRVGEFGIGLNPFARIRGAIIEDEGALGTAHMALGDSTRLGGKNKAPLHVDLVLKHPHVEFDGRTVLLEKNLTLL
jgi:leucyl aminopeptidase (aminopeptidase T)